MLFALSLALACKPTRSENPLWDPAPCEDESAAWSGLDRATEVVFVEEGGDGDGSADAPMGSLAEAAAEAAERGGLQVAVLPGTYREDLPLTAEHAGLRLAGRCAGEVVVDGSLTPLDEAGEPQPTVRIDLEEGQEVFLSALTLSGGQRAALLVQGGAVTAEGLTVRENTGGGLKVTGQYAPARLALSASVITENLQDEEADLSGAGLRVEYGGTAHLAGVDILDNPNFGVSASNVGTIVTLEEVTISGSYYTGYNSFAAGVLADKGAYATLDRVTIEGAEGVGLLVGTSLPGQVDMVDSTITGTFPAPEYPLSNAIYVLAGSTLTDQGSRIIDNDGVSISAIDRGSSLYLSGTEVSGTQPLSVEDWPADQQPSAALSGLGITLSPETALEGRNLTIDRNQCYALFATAATVFLVDSVISNTAQGSCPSESGTTGETTHFESNGIRLENAASLSMIGGEVVNNAYRGVVIQDSTAILSGVLIEGTTGLEGHGGDGLWVAKESMVQVSSSIIRANAYTNVTATLGASLRLVDSTIESPSPFALSAGDDPVALGLTLHEEASVTVQRCAITDSAPMAVSVGTGSDLTLEDTTLSARGSEVTAEDGSVRTLGYSLLASGGSSVIGQGVLVEDSYTVGALINAASADDASTPAYDESRTSAIFRDTDFLRTGLDSEGTGNTGLVVSGPAEVALEDVTIADTQGTGLLIYDGALVTGTGVTVEGSLLYGALIGVFQTHYSEPAPEGLQTSVEFEDSSFSGAGSSSSTLPSAGLLCMGPVDVTLTGVSLEANVGVGLLAAYATTLDLTDVSIAGTEASSLYAAGVGLKAGEEARLDATRLQITDTAGPGMLLIGDCEQDVACAGGSGAVVVCADCAFTNNQFAGAEVILGDLTLSGSELRGTEVHPDIHGGVGLVAWAMSEQPSRVAVTGGSIEDNALAGAYLAGPGSYAFAGVRFAPRESPRYAPAPDGQAVLAHGGVGRWDQSAGLLLEGNTFEPGAAETILLSGASATLSGNAWPSDGSLVQQACSADLLPPEGLEEVPHGSICPTYSTYVETEEFIFGPGLDIPTVQLPGLKDL